MEVKMTGLDAELAKLRKAKEVAVDIPFKNSAQSMLKELVLATPIDTGEARASWKMTKSKKGFTIANDVPYIEALNNGHSQQAPSHFIERIALGYGKAVGTIVTKTPD